MKRYIKSDIQDSYFDVIQEDIEDYIDDYYGTLGYEEDEIVPLDCEIREQSNKDGKAIYKISISLDTLDTRDVKDICEQLNLLTGYNGLPVELYEPFSYDGEYTFTGFIIER